MTKDKVPINDLEELLEKWDRQIEHLVSQEVWERADGVGDCMKDVESLIEEHNHE